jgi:hypothetical protein
MKRASSREYRFSKTLFTLSRCRIAEDDGSRNLPSRSHMYIDERYEVASAAQQHKRWNLDALVTRGCSCVATSMAGAHIYRENSARVIVSRNWLGLSLSKHIRHRLVVKINGKWRLWAYEALGQISVDYSCACRVLAPIASPCHAMPRLAGPDEVRWVSACVFLPFSSSPHTCKCIESNPPYKYASLHLH